jgi:hypothetical protein
MASLAETLETLNSKLRHLLATKPRYQPQVPEPDLNVPFTLDSRRVWQSGSKEQAQMRANRSLTFLVATAGLLAIANPAAAAVRTYFSPEIGGYLAGSCLADGRSCGKPAADAWCKTKGWNNALIFQRDTAPAVTRLIDSGELCAGPACMAFRQIKCFSPETAEASPAPSGG